MIYAEGTKLYLEQHAVVLHPTPGYAALTLVNRKSQRGAIVSNYKTADGFMLVQVVAKTNGVIESGSVRMGRDAKAACKGL